MFSKYKKINKDELYELQRLNEVVGAEKLKLICISGNTLLFEKGQDLKKNQENLVSLLEQKRQEYMGQVLARLGYPPKTNVSVNIKTGKIIINEPANS